eukprot:m.286735 g.286735  ORF g.286735 m.286735 type:complete len:519 (-) comp22928_c3_seq2:119-1675(-)
MLLLRAEFVGCLPVKKNTEDGPPDADDARECIKYIQRPWRKAGSHRFGLPKDASFCTDDIAGEVCIGMRTTDGSQTFKFPHPANHVSAVGHMQRHVALIVRNEKPVPGYHAGVPFACYILQCPSKEEAAQIARETQKFIATQVSGNFQKRCENLLSSSNADNTVRAPQPEQTSRQDSSESNMLVEKPKRPAPRPRGQSTGAGATAGTGAAPADEGRSSNTRLSQELRRASQEKRKDGTTDYKMVKRASRKSLEVHQELPAEDVVISEAKWFRGALTRQQSRTLFEAENIQPGDFFIRCSRSNEGYTLSVMNDDMVVEHYRVLEADGFLSLDGQPDMMFPTVRGLLAYFLDVGLAPGVSIKRPVGGTPLVLEDLRADAKKYADPTPQYLKLIEKWTEEGRLSDARKLKKNLPAILAAQGVLEVMSSSNKENKQDAYSKISIGNVSGESVDALNESEGDDKIKTKRKSKRFTVLQLDNNTLEDEMEDADARSEASEASDVDHENGVYDNWDGLNLSTGVD